MNDDEDTPMAGALVANPFAASALADTAGARQNQSREMAEMQTLCLMAHQFPRNERACMDKILNEFTRSGLAEKAQYQYARGGNDITGPSIRSAETIGRCWKNFEFGWRELSRSVGPDGVGFCEVEAYAIDTESRTRRRLGFIVRHWRDTKAGGYKLKDERDIFELMSNNAQRRVRSCILALMPGDVIEAAMNQADVTLKATARTDPEAMKKMLEVFAPYGVTKEMIETRIQRRLDAIQPAQVVALKRIYTSLRDDMSTAADWFDMPSTPVAPPTTTVADLAAKPGRKPKPQPAPPAAAATVAPDPETGEVPPPPPAQADAFAPPRASYAVLADRIHKAEGAELASLILDEGRALPVDQYRELVAIFDARFPA